MSHEILSFQLLSLSGRSIASFALHYHLSGFQVVIIIVSFIPTSKEPVGPLVE